MTSNIEQDSQAMQAHLTILQSIIQRMAANSNSSKAWCIALVSAILVIIADKGKPKYAWIAVMPSVLFFVLDTYYLALERGFRNSYDDFITKLHGQKVKSQDLYNVMPTGGQFRLFWSSMKSFSVWPFYFTLLAMIYIASRFVIGEG